MERRDFLRALPVGAVALAGCSGGGTDTETSTATPTETPTPTPTASPTPDADLTVIVGPDGNLVYDPEQATVDVGATVAWVWDSGGHSVTVESTPDGADWSGTGTTLHDAGYVHEHTFDTEGVYDYYCNPHRSAGMIGQLTVGDATPTPTETETDTPTETETATATASADMTVTVGPGGSLAFDPETFTISTGDTVRWEWDSAGHNVSPEQTPSGADWSGKDDDTYDAGTTYAYTFDVAGEYKYHCDPHQSIGMVGSFTVE
ncbi:plastocyanin/azurin family copper-binding protein [Halosegnis sp.]|uniref:plastocyanin/azurin family copper-binding protein n=1 Tax=Halosegnis sp. TaxID=2864959 RepID=UPI0035D4652F